ncbi:MAG: phosphate ABC transporter ATP-binding protein [Desulfovibrio sp.]
MPPVISINNLSVAFENGPVVSNVNMHIKQNELTVLVGRSGSGKSTLLRAINRLNESLVGHATQGCTTEGDIHVQLSDTTLDVYSPKTDLEQLRSRVGMVFQTPNVLPVSIARNLLLPQKLVKGTTGDDAQRVMEQVLDDVGLLAEVKDRLDQPAATLSGGQQQRLCLARTLALKPEILLLDEPTASVDYRSAELIEELLLKLAPTLPMLVVSHSLSQTQKLADRVILMREGKIVGEWLDSKSNKEDNFAALLATAF